MRILFVTMLLAGTLRADFGYESRTRFTGGILLKALLEKESFARAAKKPVVSTHLIKGTRMATVTKEHATVVDLGKETIVEIDFARKTYFTVTFARVKQILDERAGHNPAVFQVSSKAAGGSKAFGFFNAKELIVTMTLDGAGKETGAQTPAHVLVDSWILTMPGFGEAEDFRRKLAEKLGYAYASGLSEIGILEPELFPGLEEVGKLFNPGDDLPVETRIRIGGPGSGDLGPTGEAPAAQKGIVSGTLSRIGSLTHKKSAPSGEEQETPGLLLELSTELSNFGSGPADESKFNVPEGFKQVQPPAPY